MGFNPRGSEAANRRRGLSPVRARGQRLGFAALALALGLVWAPSAAALTFAFRCPPDCSPREGAGRLLESEFIYDQDSLSFSWTARFAEVDGRLPDGFWMVVSEGRVRNRTEDGLPILYGDAATGRVSAYVYDRERGRDSFEDTAGFIETFANAFSATDEPNGDRTLRVSLNTAGLNSFSQDPEWRGLAFDTSIEPYTVQNEMFSSLFTVRVRREPYNFPPLKIGSFIPALCKGVRLGRELIEGFASLAPASDDLTPTFELGAVNIFGMPCPPNSGSPDKPVHAPSA